MFKRIFSFLRCLSLDYSASQSPRGFNGAGHMTVANLAYNKLSPETKSRVAQLLELNPYYERWQSGIPSGTAPEDRALRVFMQASMWSDDIKRDRKYVNDRSDGSTGPGKGLVQSASDYSDMRMHKYWHYIDMPFSNDGTELPPIVAPNLETQLIELSKVIASETHSDEQKSYALVWLLHLVGDAHQPLHAGARVSKSDKEGDKGGNKVFVVVDGRNTKLHFFWDDVLGMDTHVDAIKHMAKKMPSEEPELATNMDPRDWIMESHRGCKKVVYAPPIGEGLGPFTITDEYRKNASAYAKRRVALAGARLANLLNDNLK